VPTIREIETLVSESRACGIKIVVYLERCRPRIVIEQMVRAVDEEGRVMSWGRAFPSLAPHQAIENCGIKRIEVWRGESLVVELSSWRDLLRSVGRIC